jgi:SAM-dependent methyltransferase
MIERGAHYYGIDITIESCKRAVHRFGYSARPYKAVIQASAAAIPFKDCSFDIVYSHGALHHIPQINSVVNQLHRVLKKDGMLVVMLYSRRSLNYTVSILFIRRMLFVLLYLFDRLTFKKMIRKRLFRAHLGNAQDCGLIRYLAASTFLSKNTDGPDNPYSRVYSRKDVNETFFLFRFIRFEQHFLNERQLVFFRLVPDFIKTPLSHLLGWHLWCYGEKR